jgi:hypothetical protein
LFCKENPLAPQNGDARALVRDPQMTIVCGIPATLTVTAYFSWLRR